jgi:hypothetical protein
MKPVKYFAQLKPKTVYLVVFFLLFLFLLYNLFIKQTILEGQANNAPQPDHRGNVTSMFSLSNGQFIKNLRLRFNIFDQSIQYLNNKQNNYIPYEFIDGLHKMLKNGQSFLISHIDVIKDWKLNSSDPFVQGERSTEPRKQIYLTFMNGYNQLLNSAITDIYKMIPNTTTDKTILKKPLPDSVKTQIIDKFLFYDLECKKLVKEAEINIMVDDYRLNPYNDKQLLIPKTEPTQKNNEKKPTQKNNEKKPNK